MRARYEATIAEIVKLYSRKDGCKRKDLISLFDSMKEQGIKRDRVKLFVQEWFASISVKAAAELLDVFSPENFENRNRMLRTQKILFERLGIDTKKKKKRKKKKKGAASLLGGELDDGEENDTTFDDTPYVRPEEEKRNWEVVVKSKKSARKAKKNELKELDRLIAEAKAMDAQQGRGKKTGNNNRRKK